MVISDSLQACGVVFPFAMLTSICRSIVTICSGLYLLIGMTSFSSKWILSHSTWYKFRRSRQTKRLVADQHSQHTLGAKQWSMIQAVRTKMELASKTSSFAAEHTDDKVELDATCEQSQALSDGQY